MGLHYFNLSTLPRLHQIVWCCLPDERGMPGETVRPALVRQTLRDPTTGRGGVVVCYGTSHIDSLQFRNKDLIIQNAERLADLNLPIAVRFDLGLQNRLPWASEFFQPPEHYLYVVAGSLSDGEKARLRVCLKNRGIIEAL